MPQTLGSIAANVQVALATDVGGGGGPHAADHENGGADEIDVTGLSGLLADPQTPDLTAHLAAGDPHPQYALDSEKGIANGYASLDATGKVPASQLPVSGSDWDGTVVKAADQQVTSSIVLTDDTHLRFPVVAGEMYRIQIAVPYTAANNTADFRFALRVTAGNMQGYWNYEGSDTTANAVLARAHVRVAGANTGTITVGTNAALGDFASIFITAQFRMSASGEFIFQWAQGAANASPTIVKQRARLQWVRIA
jgi:hypothetical protein